MLRYMSGAVVITVCNLRTMQFRSSTNMNILNLKAIENEIQEVPLIVSTINKDRLSVHIGLGIQL